MSYPQYIALLAAVLKIGKPDMDNEQALAEAKALYRIEAEKEWEVNRMIAAEMSAMPWPMPFSGGTRRPE